MGVQTISSLTGCIKYVYILAYVYAYEYVYVLVLWLDCSPMVRETGVPSQVEW